jgi:RNA polymerase sigma-70 factor (ECF subfamily)
MANESGDTTLVTLLHRINQNPADQLSWAEFVRVYSPAIRSWLAHWGLQEADAQDVAQNVLVRLTKKLPKFEYDPSKSFRGWLKTLTHHAWHDFVTEAGYRTRASGDTSVLDRLNTVAVRVDLEARVEATFDKELLEMALDRARARVRADTWQAFKLAALGGAAPQTVAEQLGMRVSQVYLAKYRVQKIVQEEVRALEGGTAG